VIILYGVPNYLPFSVICPNMFIKYSRYYTKLKTCLKYCKVAGPNVVYYINENILNLVQADHVVSPV
jgi:hypothetical protein